MAKFPYTWFLATFLLFVKETYSINGKEVYSTKVTSSGENYQELITGIKKPQKDTREYAGIKLANKLNAILVSDPKADKSSAALLVKIGHLDDPKELPGLAHFLEHLLFLGSKKYPNLDDFNSFIGNNSGACNAMTDYDFTSYYYDINNSAFETSLDIFSQFFTAPLISQEAVDKEINAVDSEFRQNMAYELWKVKLVSANLTNPEHPYSLNPIGNRKSLIDIPKSKGFDTRSEAETFFKEKYSANLMNLAVVSNKPMKDLKDLVVSKFSGINNLNLPKPSYPGPVYRNNEKAIQINVVPKSTIYSMDFEFELPTQIEDYQCNPLIVISKYLSYDGEGSFIEDLKNNGLVTKFHTELNEGYNGFAILHISSELTLEGMNQKDKIAETLFKFLNSIKHSSTIEEDIRESKFMSDINFMFGETKKGTDLTTDLVSGMASSTPLEEALFPIGLTRGYNETYIRNFFEYITPRNMRITLVDPSNSALPNLQTEQWSGAKFTHNKIDEELISKLEQIINAPRRSKKNGDDRPPPNRFIPTKFEKVQPATNIKHPVKLYTTKSNTLWHATGEEQSLKVGINVLMCSNIHPKSTLDIVHTQLLKNLISDSLANLFEEGKRAGMENTLKIEGCGISLQVTGFDQHIELYFKTIIELISSSNVVDKKLNNVVKGLRSKLEYFEVSPFDIQSKQLFEQMFVEDSLNSTVLLKSLDDVTLENTSHFKREFLATVTFKTLAVGNITPEKAIAIAKNIDQLAVRNEDNTINTTALRIVSFPEGESWKYNILLGNDESDQNDISCFLEFNDIYNYEQEIYTRLIGSNILNFSFDVYRNKMQLGYYAGAEDISIGRKSGIYSRINSNHLPNDIEESIETMFTLYYEHARRMSDKEFSSMVNSFAESIQNLSRNAEENTEYYWNFIIDQSYNFDYEDKLLMQLQDVTQSKLLEILSKNFLKNSSQRRKFSVRMISPKANSETNSHSSQNVGTIIEDIADWKNNHLL